MAYTEQSGFLRDAPPAGGSLGALVVTGITGGGSSGPDPAEGTQGGALPTSVLWIAGADGTVLRGMAVDSTGRLRTVVEGTVAVANFPAVQPVNDNGGSLTVDAPVGAPVRVDPTGTTTQPVSGTVAVSNLPATQDVSDRDARILGRTKIHDGTNVAQVLNSAPASDTGQSGVAVRVISQLGAGSGGGGSALSQADKSTFAEGTGLLTPIGGVVNDTITADPAEDTAAALRLTVKRGLHVNLRNVAGTEVGTAAAPVRTDPTGTTAQPVTGTFWQATQPVSGTVTANQGTAGGTAWPVAPTPQTSATATQTNVASSATSVALKASNASRKALYIFNAGTSPLFVNLGAAATTTTAFVNRIPPNGFWELPDDPVYTGAVNGIWSATGGNGANVVELT